MAQFQCVFMDRDAVEVPLRKERGQYPAILTEQAWSIKDLLYGMKHQNMKKFSLQDKALIPREQDSSILPALVANHNARFGSSFSLRELVINNTVIIFG